MGTGEEVYNRVQRHLDRQAVGFPATKSGAEIRILKHIFTPREGEIATCLTYRFEPLETVFKRAADLVESREELAELLERIEKKGGIEKKSSTAREYIAVPPLWWGCTNISSVDLLRNSSRILMNIQRTGNLE